MDEFRDDGTLVCPIHGLRYDPALAPGCIRCPRPSNQPARASRAPSRTSMRGPAPSSQEIDSRLPPPRPPMPSSPGPAPRASSPPTPPIPFEPGMMPSGAPVGGPRVISILPAPARTSRRPFVLAGATLLVAGLGAFLWEFRPDSIVDWSSKVKPLAWSSPLGPREGALFVPSDGPGPWPLLVLIDPNLKSRPAVARYAAHAQRHGYVLAASNGLGRDVKPDDDVEVAALVEYVRTVAPVESGRPMLSGYDGAASCAYRLAALFPDSYAGAIVEEGDVRAWRDVGAFARAGTPLYLFTRKGDFQREHMLTLKDEMERRGMSVTLEELPGGHDPMEKSELDEVFRWMDGVLGRGAPGP